MSNIMNMKHLENKVTKNGFDLSNRNCFTAKVGEILPIYTRMLYPNQKVKVKTSSFTRTIPLNTAAYTRVREYYDFFFVPIRLLWRYSDQFFTQMRDSYGAISPTQNGDEVPQLPYFGRRKLLEKLAVLYRGKDNLSNGKDIFNRPRYATIEKLLEYLDYGILNSASYSGKENEQSQPKNFAVTPFRLLAYQKIYYDYFRMSQWEKNMPQFYNIDYINPQSPLLTSLLDTLDTEKQTIFDLHYCNYNKDLFTGILPTSQFGDESNVSITGDGQTALDLRTANGEAIARNSYTLYPAVNNTKGVLGYKDDTGQPINILTKLNLEGNIAKMSVLALRQAEALQKWKEIAFSGNEDYRTQIKKHFGIDPGPVRSAICEHLGGFQSNIQISEVVNQNLTGEYSADIQGKGISSSDGFIEYECKEHGFFMCIYHAKPILEYSAIGIAPDITKTYPQDFVIPEFDRIGMQTIPNQWLTADQTEWFNPGDDRNTIAPYTELGFTPRYAEFKTDVDRIHGAFNRSYNTWVAPWNTEYINSLLAWNDVIPGLMGGTSYVFFKVPPFALDSILSIKHDAYDNSDSDHFLCCVDFNIDSLQPIDRDGLPY